MNHIIKGSDQLTVLIFCDGESRLEGTPYDDSINGNGTNGVARGKESQSSIIILRAAHGEYVGCSVNQYGSLNFPKFPPPPKPKPLPPVKPVVVTPPPAPARPAASIIVVGTKNTNTTVSVEARSVPGPVAPPVPAATPSPAATPAVEPAPAPAPIPKPKVSTAPPVTPAPAATPVPASGTPAAAPANPPGVVATVTVSESGSWLPLVIGGVVLLIALNVTLWLVLRARQPRGSLITSSFEQDKHPPK